MADIKQGAVVVQLPSHIELLPQAGRLGADELRSLEKARRGVGLACEQTAEAMRKNPERLAVPGLSAEELLVYGRQAEDIDAVIIDLENALSILRQNNALLDARAHQALRRVLAQVRGLEKFDPKITGLVPHLLEYFTRARYHEPDEEAPTSV